MEKEETEKLLKGVKELENSSMDYSEAQAKIAQKLFLNIITKMPQTTTKRDMSKTSDLSKGVTDVLGKLMATPEFTLAGKGLTAFGELGENGFMLMRTIYRENKTPFKIFSENKAPKGIKRKKDFYECVDKLVSKGYLIKKKIDNKKSEWIINEDILKKKFNCSAYDLFAIRDWINTPK